MLTYNEKIKLNMHIDKESEQLTKEEREQRVYLLEVELTESLLEKKSFVRAANENIKRIKAEIKDLVKQDVKTLEIH